MQRAGGQVALEIVQGGASQPSVAERAYESALVDDAAAADVDEDRAGRDELDRVRVDQAAGLLVACDRQMRPG